MYTWTFKLYSFNDEYEERTKEAMDGVNKMYTEKGNIAKGHSKESLKANPSGTNSDTSIQCVVIAFLDIIR